mgnify:CR=1 FL=1
MPCHVAKSTSVSSRLRRQRLRQSAPSLPPLAVLDLSKPIEREMHDFLIRATSKRFSMWKLIDMRRHGAMLLCVVQWVRRADDKPFSLAEVSLEKLAVCWQDYATVEAARSELTQRCAEPSPSNGTPQAG